MDVRCFVCGAVLSEDAQAHAEIYKLKDVSEAYAKKHFRRIYDGFIYIHHTCWVETGRFDHYPLDLKYFMEELEKRIYRAPNTCSKK